MTDVKMLREVIESSGMTMVALAKKSGILRETLYARLSSGGDFKASEIVGLVRALRLTKQQRDSIFFAEQCVIK
jgi:DNA-binding phage protein